MVFNEEDELIPLDACKPLWITSIRLWSDNVVGMEDSDPNCEKELYKST
jgi:hypothetical protein